MDLGCKVPIKGVICKGYTVREELDEVVGAHRLTRIVDGVRRKPTPSTLLLVDEESLPSHMHLGFMKYHVRAFVPKPVQCDKCK